MEQLIKFISVYLPNTAAWLTVAFVVYKLLKTKHGEAFIKYISNIPHKELIKKVNTHEERLNKIDIRLDKGDDKFKELAKDIKAGDLSNREQLNQINNNVNMILEILIKGKED